MLGCDITTPGGLGSPVGTRSANGSIIQFNRFTGPTAQLLDVGTPESVVGFSFSQNLVEVTTSTGPGLRASGDSGIGNLTHVLFDNNTATGYGSGGRFNLGYNETTGTQRTHKFFRQSNSIIGNMYTKHDVFLGTNGNGSPDPVGAPLHVGGWSFLYQVGSRNNWTQFGAPATNGVGASEGPAYAGLSTTLGTSMTVRNDPIFMNYQGLTASAGVGGGDYRLQAGSPCIGLVAGANEVFSFDLAGIARTRGAIGAYA